MKHTKVRRIWVIDSFMRINNAMINYYNHHEVFLVVFFSVLSANHLSFYCSASGKWTQRNKNCRGILFQECRETKQGQVGQVNQLSLILNSLKAYLVSSLWTRIFDPTQKGISVSREGLPQSFMRAKITTRISTLIEECQRGRTMQNMSSIKTGKNRA